MSKFSRKINRSNLSSDRKDAKKKLDSLQGDINSLPESCTICDADFDLKKDADSWMVIQLKNQAPSLICPSCFEEKKL